MKKGLTTLKLFYFVFVSRKIISAIHIIKNQKQLVFLTAWLDCVQYYKFLKIVSINTPVEKLGWILRFLKLLIFFEM